MDPRAGKSVRVKANRRSPRVGTREADLTDGRPDKLSSNQLTRVGGSLVGWSVMVTPRVNRSKNDGSLVWLASVLRRGVSHSGVNRRMIIGRLLLRQNQVEFPKKRFSKI